MPSRTKLLGKDTSIKLVIMPDTRQAVKFQTAQAPTGKFYWKNVAAMKIKFKQTLGGLLPVISTANHDDFCQMVALLTGRELKKYPLTVNAFTIPCRAEKIYRHRVILLNAAPYSNISAEKIGLSVEDW